MFQIFIQGGPLFMGILTVLFVGVIYLAIRSFSDHTFTKKMTALGLLALVIGILGQLIGLFSAFSAMEGMQGTISPSILAGGLKISMIPTIYGIIIFIISHILRFIVLMKE